MIILSGSNGYNITGTFVFSEFLKMVCGSQISQIDWANSVAKFRKINLFFSFSGIYEIARAFSINFLQIFKETTTINSLYLGFKSEHYIKYSRRLFDRDWEHQNTYFKYENLNL